MPRMIKGRFPGDLLFWWIPQVPMKAFEVRINSIAEGRKLEMVLADYDDFQFKNRIKPDYSNTGGIARWEPDPDKAGFDWFDVEDDEQDIDPTLWVRCDGLPGVNGCTFIELEDDNGVSFGPNIGVDWKEEPEGNALLGPFKVARLRAEEFI